MSSLIGAGHIDIITFLEKIMFACRVYCFSCFIVVFCLLPIAYFSRLVHKLPRQVRKAIEAIWMHRMRELLYRERSVHHLDFSPIKGILCVPLYSLIAFEIISLS